MKIAVGLSGGVDSSVTAMLLKEQGHQVVGITMKLWSGRYKGGDRDACFGVCEEKSIAMADAFAKQAGIEYRVFDVSGEYEKSIIRYFRETYLDGRTPNPCVRCNAMMKFGLLPELAIKVGLGFDKFATGHYARIKHCANGRLAVMRAVDESKDQSYFLYRLSQEQLSRQLFPLGEKTKVEVRELAHAFGLVAADRPDSQDFYSGDVSELIGSPARQGDIVDISGKKVGSHSGFWRYTIGQRKGLCIGGAGEPYYVVDINAARNEVIVGREGDAIRASLEIEDPSFMALEENDLLASSQAIPCSIKVRSGGKPRGPAFIQGLSCSFPEGISGIAPGQSAVFYDAEGVILAGGIIKRNAESNVLA